MGESVGAGDLAGLLRELKERSGLSYGALAKRLHVSTSTLHRYVNGSAVPTEFAPLERLARMCGASREEMVEVHRQWILADASRGDRKEGDAQRGTTEPPRAAGPDAPAAPAAAAAPVAPAGEAAPGSAPTGSPAKDPDKGPDKAPANDPAKDSDFVIGPAPAPAGKSGGRRLPRARVLVAAGAVLALGATAVAVQAASGSGGERERASATTPGPHGGEGAWDRDATGSPSPSAKGKPGKKASESSRPAGDGKGVEGTTGAPGAGGAGGGGKGGGESDTYTGTDTGAAPVTVSTQPQYWSDPCGHPYLVDKEPGTLSPPPNEQDAEGWVAANGAVSARDQTVKLTVQGTGEETVVLESLHVRVAGTSSPLAWNNYKMGYLGVGCGGNVPKHSFDVNLDASVPRPAPQGSDDFPYKVSASDPEAFYVNATANSRYVRWYLELEWSSGDRHGTVRIDDTGKPFATSGDRGRPVYGFSLNSKKWTKTNRDNDDVPDPPA
ncbi:helix-turn-helix domain-containing protein [Streptomyces sp. SYP-A7185]|uniref:helix-turn-helix domain-containing protein n=1 Tax=Streptomyces sp. SYP-A7185 TaxID=3040076 RepID=UPI0038F6750A